MKKFFYSGGIIALIAIMALIYAVFHTSSDKPLPLNNNQSLPTPSSSNLPLDQNGNPKSPYGTSTYSNEQGGYSFDYPTDLFTQSKKLIDLPYKSSIRISADEFSHTIPVEHCALSGVCEPNTTDMAWGAALLQDDISVIQKSTIGGELKPVKVQEIQAYEYRQGAEGEGIVYTFIPHFNDAYDGTILTYHRYIDENVEVKYKTALGFIPLTQQEQIYNTIIQTLD